MNLTDKKHSLNILRTLLLSICGLLLSSYLLAQAGKTPAQKEKPPTQKEMEDMMKEAQKAMNEISPEDKKIMDSLGIKMPSFNNVPKFSDAQLAEAWEDETRLVPKKDDTRIASISRTPLSSATMGAYLSDIHSKITAKLTPNLRSLAESVYKQLKLEGANPAVLGFNAAGLWLTGHTLIGLYVMGKVCIEDPGDIDNISNYAAMISMVGIEQKAIPVLNYLNNLYPRNSTILNNLGQAWFGLGEINKATKYLDSTIMIYAMHPQANLTKSLIEEDKGNKEEAVKLVKKSLQHSYSQEKVERLRKLGYKPSDKDFRMPPVEAGDLLNLGGNTMPPFPKSVDECIALEGMWKDFRNNLTEEGDKIAKEMEAAIQRGVEIKLQRGNADLNMVKASQQAGRPLGSLSPEPIYYSRAKLKLKEINDDYARKTKILGQKLSEYMQGEGLRVTMQYRTEMEQLSEEDAEQTGEGKANKDYCPKYKAATDKYLSAYNSKMEEFHREAQGILKPYLNELVQWQIYASWPEDVSLNNMAAKVAWLGALKATPPTFESITKYKCDPVTGKKGGPLQKFDDVACKYHSEMNMIFGTLKADCSNFTTKIDAKFIKLGLKQDMDQDNFSDQFKSFSVEVRASVGEKVKLGPIQAGVKATAGAGMEIDRNGVKDVYVVGGVSAKIGGVGGGAEGRISMMTGQTSGRGTGMFSGIK